MKRYLDDIDFVGRTPGSSNFYFDIKFFDSMVTRDG
jgi:hypothetical protein